MKQALQPFPRTCTKFLRAFDGQKMDDEDAISPVYDAQSKFGCGWRFSLFWEGDKSREYMNNLYVG